MRIALYGSAPSSVLKGPTKDASYAEYVGGRALLEKHQFPFIEQEWQVWACSPGTYGVLERIDRFFELHRWEPGQPWFSPEYCSFLRAFGGPVYTAEAVPEIANSVRLPREALVAAFGPFVWASSLSYMLALAMLEIGLAREAPGHDPAQDAIGLFGVDMAATEEYKDQRICCQVLIHEARQRGIRVLVPPESDLLRPLPMYGLCEWTPVHIKSLTRQRELQARLAAARSRSQEANNEMYFLMGAVDNQEYMMKTWLYNEPAEMVAPDAQGQQLLEVRPS